MLAGARARRCTTVIVGLDFIRAASNRRKRNADADRGEEQMWRGDGETLVPRQTRHKGLRVAAQHQYDAAQPRYPELKRITRRRLPCADGGACRP